MKIHMESIKILINILKEDKIDYKKLTKFVKTKEVRGFIQHEKTFNRKTSEDTITEEIIKLKTQIDYKDKYDFYIIKNNINIIVYRLNYIEEHQELIMEYALKRIKTFIPQSIKVNSNIYLYIGGIDGGFSVYGKDVFINYIKYFNEIDELIKIISHELFHCRIIPFKNKFKVFLTRDTKKYIYEVLGKILEEGIALLIQHGIILRKNDPIGTITKEKMEKVEEEFEVLDCVLLKLKEGNIDYLELRKIDIYSIGYYIVNFIYKYYDEEILESWIFKYDYNRPIKSYIYGIRKEGLSSGFSKEIENWILES
ncbi:DUF5700 domain-containing putative Zn-dependent protease [Tissierella sp. MB52-C2]|uniref:DUF5700 domain-containing putative Zn-dependent protease n=1 Tax=Tissierella sp. MB52-C2 TaxID=3070999 RepID=UPI00280C37A5|nr:DUF5700 domain-containing putative Zn-dependent protease [Tissierella sp. MB52-C2]WMM25942.1 DUF5700 domain-containing putative Zn-dependent protease [Tissierella sp. MB52-C2]